jgi:hypothetical protein
MDEEMKALVSRLAKYLKKSEQQLCCFHKCESQVEGWFKGELLCFLDQEKLAGRLSSFEREKKLYVHVGDKRKRMQIDFVLHFDETNRSRISWVELKHWIKTQNNTNYYCNGWYFTTPSTNCNSCVQRGVEQLMKINGGDGAKFILVLCTDNPGSKDWNSGVEKFKHKFPQLAVHSVHSLTNPDNYPEYFFLGLLHVPD